MRFTNKNYFHSIIITISIIIITLKIHTDKSAFNMGYWIYWHYIIWFTSLEYWRNTWQLNYGDDFSHEFYNITDKNR